MCTHWAGHAIPFYSSRAALEEVERRFSYAFRPVTPGRPVYRPALAAQPIDGPFSVAGIPVVPFWQSHGFSQTLGFRLRPVGHSPDVLPLDDIPFDALAGTDLAAAARLR